MFPVPGFRLPSAGDVLFAHHVHRAHRDPTCAAIRRQLQCVAPSGCPVVVSEHLVDFRLRDRRLGLAKAYPCPLTILSRR